MSAVQRKRRRAKRGEAASLANNVTDGPWRAGLYPDADIIEIASGLIWRQLGSPYAEDRWRAAHSIRSLTRFNRWDVIDRLVDHAAFTTAGPFQASELGFYYLHARVWLLIALARVALDDPAQVARYHDVLWGFVFDEEHPHLLMRHFARSALIACVDAGALRLPPQKKKVLEDAEQSPLPRLHEKIRKGGGFYHGRPKDVPEPEFEFHLDMDFHKQDVDNLAHVFGKGTWEVADLMSEIVRQLDPNIKSMYDKKGRESRHNRDGYGMGDRDHSYGQQLGWHALFFAAGKLLKAFPVTDDWWGHTDSDPWLDWLRRYTLTREDGYWLSDGTDRTPLDTQTILLQKGKKDLELTGDQDTIQRLVNISSPFPEEIVIEGDWYSADLIKVSVSSALVAPKDAQSLAQKLLDEEPISAYVPTLQFEDEDDSDNESEEGYDAWVLNPSGEARLDRLDPLGVDEANRRPRLTRKYAALAKIAAVDPFGRTWASEDAKPVLRAEAWGRSQTDDRRESHPGLRLLLRVPTLLELLKMENKVLLLLVVLRRSEQRPSRRSSSKWTHTVAVIMITQNGKITYLPGKINHLHEDRW